MTAIMRFLLPLLALFAIAPTAAAQDKAPLVLAAASMQEALTDAADAWTRTGHERPRISFAASSALARQIAAGGRADLFVSADSDWMDDLAKRGLIVPGTRAILVRNQLVVVARPGLPRVAATKGAASENARPKQRATSARPASRSTPGSSPLPGGTRE